MHPPIYELRTCTEAEAAKLLSESQENWASGVRYPFWVYLAAVYDPEARDVRHVVGRVKRDRK